MARWKRMLIIAGCVAMSGCGGAGGSGSAQHSDRTSSIGGTGEHSTISGSGPGQKSAIRVGSLSLGVSDAHTLVSSKAEDEKTEVPDAPTYSRCRANLKQRSTGKGLTSAQLRERCRRLDRALKVAALSSWIDNAWGIAEAEEQHVGVSEVEATAKLGVLRKKLYPSKKAFDELLRRTHQTVASLTYGVRAELAQERIVSRLKSKAVSPAGRARYFRRHERDFQRGERRDLRVIQTRSRASAARALSELNAHKAFLLVAKSFSSPKIRTINEAEDLGVEKQSLAPSTVKVVFSAQTGRFYGPVKSGRDFYVFEVVKVYPAEHRTLADVERQESAALDSALGKEALVRFLAGWRAKWKARTTCEAGFVIPKCSEYRGAVKVKDPYQFS